MTTLFRYALLALGVTVHLGLAGCHALSKAEREMRQQSPEALCAGVVKAYKTQDLKAFLDLAISHRDLKELMSRVDVPAAARRESQLSGGEYKDHIQDSLRTVLVSSGVAWEKASFEKFVPARNPVEIAEGYHMLLGNLYILAGDKRYSQSITIVEIGKGRFFMGDFSPIELE